MVNAWGNHISNCLSENNETDGINITGTQVYLNNVYSAMNDGHGIDCRAYHVTMTNVQSYSNGKNGFYILNGEQAYTNCIASRSDQLETTWSDFYIMSANGIQLTNCFSLGEAEIAHPINGFRIRSSTRITLNTCTAEECVTGIYIQDDCTKVIINNCVVETNTTPITDSAPDTIIKNTIGYVTENYGSMSELLCSGFVAHGLATAPIYINLTPGHGGCVCKDYNATVTSGSINASGFHVSLVTTCSGVPASGLVYWEAKV